MRRAERLFRLIQELRSRNIARAQDLAETLEVSLNTIYRDIAHLQASGLPIDGEAGVGYLLRDGFDLPNITLTHDQLDALALGLAFVEASDDVSLSHAAQEVRSKLQGALPEPNTRRLLDAPMRRIPTAGQNDKTLPMIRQAIREQRYLRMQYQKSRNDISRRSIEPLLIWSLNNGWMLTAWCRLREDFRNFRNDRIVALHMTEERFENAKEKRLQFLELDACKNSKPRLASV